MNKVCPFKKMKTVYLVAAAYTVEHLIILFIP